MILKVRAGQTSIEYLVIVGFITFVVIGILGIALVYSNSIQDRILIVQLNNCANKIVSTSESVFYEGYPSKATINCYLPKNIKDIEILDDGLYFKIQLSSGVNKISFSSNVKITGTLNPAQGLKKIEIVAQNDQVVISSG